MEKTINICYITDEKYSLPTVTSILSVIEYSKSPVNIYVIANNVPKNIINYFESLSDSNVNVYVKELELENSDKIKEHLYVSKAALLKFKIAETFSDLDKILYLDGDTLVFDDLEELYNTDISEYYAAVISDYAAVYKEKHHIRLNHENYFNSGVMLLNLNKFRQENLAEKLIDYKKNKDIAHFMDQDAFNVVFSDNVLFINPKYNMMLPNLINCDVEKFAKNYNLDKKEAEDLLFNEKYIILHLTNKAKPWNSIGTDWFHLWFYFFRKITLPDLKCVFYDNFVEMSHKQLVLYFNYIVKLYDKQNQQ